MWKKVQGNNLPIDVEEVLDEQIVYVRHNIIEANNMYEYDEAIIKLRDWQDYSYGDVVSLLIRARYNQDDEFALQRQRDSKVEEFEAYNTYCEECKVKARELRPLEN